MKKLKLKCASILPIMVVMMLAFSLNAQQTKRNIIANSNFEDGLKHWRWDAGLESSILFSADDTNPISGGKSAKIQVLSKKAEPWQQTFYYYLPIEENAQYRVTLKIKSSIENATVRLELCQSEFGWGINFKPIDLEDYSDGFTPDTPGNPDLRGALSVGTETKEISFLTKGTQFGYPNYVFSFHFGHADIATYWIDDIKISRVDDGDWDGNLFPVGNFESNRIRNGNNQGYYIDGRILNDPLSIAELSTVNPISGNKTFHIVKDINTPGTADYWALSYHFQFWNNDVPNLDISFKAKSSDDCKIPLRLIANPWGWGGGDIIQWEVPLTTELQEITLAQSQAVNWIGKGDAVAYDAVAIPAYDWFHPNPNGGGFKGRMSLHGSLIDDNITKKGVEIWMDDLVIKESNLNLQSFTVASAPDEVKVSQTVQFEIGKFVYPTHAPSTVVFSVENQTGSAVINQEGVLTGTSKGNVKVIIDTPNGTDRKEYTVAVTDDTPEPIEHIYVKPMNISFGGVNYEGWNILTAMRTGGKIINIKDREGNPTQASLLITESFNGTNNNGPTSTTTSMNLPNEVVVSNFFGNVGSFGDGSYPKATIKITGLYPDVSYSFEMFASRMGVADNRETYYKFTGDGDAVTVYLNASNNQTNTVATTGIMPNEDGEIIMEIGPGPNNTNGSKFYHLALMRITPNTTLTTIVPFTNKINLSMGYGAYDAGWNVLADFRVNSSATNLRDSDGKATNVNLIVTKEFNSINGDGATETSTSMNMPLDASKWSFYGNSKLPFLGKTVEKSKIKFTGLDAQKNYNFEIYASRNGVADNREAYYKFVDTDKIVYLDAANNINNIVNVEGILPNSSGEIEIEIGPGPNNTNGTGFYYLGAITIFPGLPVGVNNPKQLENQPYPNPFNNMLNVFVNDKDDVVKIFSIDGRMLMSVDKLIPESFNKINTGALTTGTYILQTGNVKSIIIKK